MIRLVIGLCLLFLGLGIATALVVHAVRRKRAAAKLRRPFQTRTHAGSESTYWATKCASDVTKAVTKTSGRQDEPKPTTTPSAYVGYYTGRVEQIAPDVPWLSECRNESDYFGVAKPREEWAPTHPCGWKVVKVDAIYYAVSTRSPADVQRYSPSMLGWVKEEDLGAWGEAVWASLGVPEGPA